ncbi:S-adenosyl-L-methionine-dependent methyltransferase [Powellomyces hirtus]|nr:S-adenosyl-L-methionine-dependent methyltransferase [Powellomyces hirtus]
MSSSTATLDLHEKQIDAAYLTINLPPTEGFFTTVKVLYTIREHKLYKQRNFSSFENYLENKWKLKRGVGNRLSVAGRVISVLEKTFPKEELPSNATLCIAVDAWSRKRNESPETVWKAALVYFEGRDDTVASRFADIYGQPPPPPTLAASALPPTPTSPMYLISSKEAGKDTTTAESEEESETSDSGFLAADPNDCISPANATLGKGQRTKRPVSYVDSSSSESEAEVAPVKKKAYGFPQVRNVFNTPQWLCDLIEQFTGGVDLDPCSNPFSKLKAKKKYGYAADGSFVNALSIDDWEPDTNFVYLNAPGTAESDKEKTQNEKHLHRYFWEKCFDEMRKGNVKRVIALIPQRSYGNWNIEVLPKALVCLISRLVAFEKNDGTLYNGDFYSRSLCYLDTDDSYPYAPRFVEVFGEIGYIPGVNMRIYKEPSMDRHLRYFSLCAGIGTAESAIHSVFRNAVCVGYSEIDPSALTVYRKHFPEHQNFGDALELKPDALPDFDLLVGGIPCQPFSRQSNNRTNFDDERSKLFDCFLRILESKAPQHFLLENVPMSPEPLAKISNELKVNPVEINAHHWTAQNRKRLYWCNWYVHQPLERPSPKLQDIIELDKRYRVTKYKDLPSNPPKDRVCSIRRNTATSTVYFRTDQKALTLVTGDCYQTIVLVNGDFRHYTVRERERLQGLPDDYTSCEGLGDTDKKRLLGNAMTLPAIEYVIRQL